jgi:hypothetical protein
MTSDPSKIGRSYFLDGFGPNYCPDTSYWRATALCTNPFKEKSLLELLACLLVEGNDLYKGTYVGAESITKAHKVFSEVFGVLVSQDEPALLDIEDLNHRVHENLSFELIPDDKIELEDEALKKYMKKKPRTMKYTKAAIRFLRLRDILANHPRTFPYVPFDLNRNRLEELFNILDVDLEDRSENRIEKKIKYGSTRIKKAEIRSVERALTPDQRTTLHRDFWEPKPIPKYVALKKKAASKEVADKRGFSDSEQERYLIYLEERIDRIQDRYASAIARLDAIEKALNLQRGEG